MSTKELRLNNVPEEIYLSLLEHKAKEEQRLKRPCNLTDGLKRMHCELKRRIESESADERWMERHLESVKEKEESEDRENDNY